MNAEMKLVVEGIRANILAQQCALNELKLDDLPAEIRQGIEELNTILSAALKQSRKLRSHALLHASAKPHLLQQLAPHQGWLDLALDNLNRVLPTGARPR